jgi:hypothetical protein
VSGTWAEFVVELATRWDVIERLMADHRPNVAGLCVECTTPEGGRHGSRGRVRCGRSPTRPGAPASDRLVPALLPPRTPSRAA